MERINPGVQAIWEGALARIEIACRGGENREACQASLSAWKAAAWGAFLATLTAEAQLVHRLISAAERDYWMQSPSMQGLEKWAIEQKRGVQTK